MPWRHLSSAHLSNLPFQQKYCSCGYIVMASPLTLILAAVIRPCRIFLFGVEFCFLSISVSLRKVLPSIKFQKNKQTNNCLWEEKKTTGEKSFKPAAALCCHRMGTAFGAARKPLPRGSVTIPKRTGYLQSATSEAEFVKRNSYFKTQIVSEYELFTALTKNGSLLGLSWDHGTVEQYYFTV